MKSQTAHRHASALLAVGLTFAWSCAAAAPDTPQATTTSQAIKIWPEPELANESIAPLRQTASAGDVDAALELATRLIERFERGGTSDDIFEAMIWIDRYHGNPTLMRSGLIGRIQHCDCGHKVLRLHPMCDTDAQ